MYVSPLSPTLTDYFILISVLGTYNYPFKTVHEAFDFTQKLTRFGESGVWGFQAHLDAREVAQLLDQSIATEGS